MVKATAELATEKKQPDKPTMPSLLVNIASTPKPSKNDVVKISCQDFGKRNNLSNIYIFVKFEQIFIKKFSLYFRQNKVYILYLTQDNYFEFSI